MRAWLKIIAVAICALALGGCDQLKPRYAGIDLGGVSWGKDFRLMDTEGHERTIADFRGKYVLVFFGYIQCPVMCPTALIRAAEARQALGADADRVQVVFITLDPERDSPDLVKGYVEAFHPSFVGLMGDLKRTEEVAREFHVYYKKVPAGNSYSIDHTVITYIFDDQGRLRLGMHHMNTVEQYVADLRSLMSPKS